ncbi:unnamed protein product [Gadus morhua 'NCC']
MVATGGCRQRIPSHCDWTPNMELSGPLAGASIGARGVSIKNSVEQPTHSQGPPEGKQTLAKARRKVNGSLTGARWTLTPVNGWGTVITGTVTATTDPHTSRPLCHVDVFT